MGNEVNQDMLCSCLDEPMRLFGLPVDEFVGCVLFLFIGFIKIGVLSGILFSALWVLLLKRIKKGKGASFLNLIIYRFGNQATGKAIFPAFPEAYKRIWW